MKDLPNVVRIIGVDYLVSEGNEREDPRLRENAAIIDHCACVIRFDESWGEGPRAVEYMLHEILHGVEVACDLRLKERVVASLARGFAAVLLDNPGLRSWIERQAEVANERTRMES